MLQQDLRFAVRWLRRNPAFSASALLVFALGIGAATATFTVIHAVILRPLPFASPDRVIRIWSSPEGRNLPFFSVSAPDVEDWRARATTLAQVGPYDRQIALTIRGDGPPEHVMSAKVSLRLFELLGVAPASGRWFDAAEDEAGSGARVAVISHGLWQRRLGGRADVIGQQLQLDDESWTIVGVMPPGFAIPNNPAEIWLPLQLVVDPAKRDSRSLRVLARLRDGATVEQATAELTRIAAALAREHPTSNRTWTVTVRSLTETVVSETFRRALIVIGGAVGLVLLIACANVAGLLLSRSTARTREMAVRMAVGASRAALVRQLLTESMVLAAAGGSAGVLLAMWALDAVSAMAAENVPRAAEIAVRPAVVLFALCATTASALLAGAMPALATSRSRLEALRDRETSGGRSTSRARDLIVIGQVAVAMVLLVGAGLMMRSFQQLQRRDLGFTSENLLVVDIAPPTGVQRIEVYEGLAERIGALPGVATVALGTSLPFAGPNSANIVAIEGRTFAPGEAPDADFRAVSGSYFRVLGIPILRGRTFERGTADEAAVLINQTAARQFFPGDAAIGRRIRLGGAPWAIVVGVVADARYLGLDDPRDDTRPMVYIPHQLAAARPLTIAVRTAVPPATLVSAIRSAIADEAPRQPITRVEPMDAILAGVRGPQRIQHDAARDLCVDRARAGRGRAVGIDGAHRRAPHARDRRARGAGRHAARRAAHHGGARAGAGRSRHRSGPARRRRCDACAPAGAVRGESH